MASAVEIKGATSAVSGPERVSFKLEGMQWNIDCQGSAGAGRCQQLGVGIARMDAGHARASTRQAVRQMFN
jgi:hypothetical protein